MRQRIYNRLASSTLSEAGVVTAAVFLLFAPFVYRCGAGEADSSSMVAGIYQAGLKGTFAAEPTLYFQHGQPLYNLLFALLVRVTGMSFDFLLISLNLLAGASTAVSCGAIYYLCRKCHIPVFAAAIGMLTFLLAPYTFELATYAHPQTVSIALMLTSFCLWAEAVGQWPVRRPAAYLAALAVVVGTIGLLFRMDGILLVVVLWAFAILRYSGGRKFFITAFAFPAAMSILALIARGQMVVSAKSTGSLEVLAPMLKLMMETPIIPSIPFIPTTLGTAGALLVIGALFFAIARRDVQAYLVWFVLIVPVTLYVCQNAHIPRRFIHLFVTAGFAVAVALRSAYAAESRISFQGKAASSNKKKNTRPPLPIVSPKAGTNPLHPRKIAGIAGLLIFGNWLLWPGFATIATAVGDPLPETPRWKALVHFIPLRHYEQQEYYCWSKKANLEMVAGLTAPHDIIGRWLNYGELLSGYSRLRIPVATTARTLRPGQPALTLINANATTQTFYSPPWDYPPGQQSPQVILLDHYGADVTYGLSRISEVAPPPGIKYHIW